MVALRRMLLALLLTGLMFVAYALVARFALHGPVTEKRLAVSITNASGALFDSDCRPTARRGTWACQVDDAATSSGSDYRVQVRAGSSCWDARRDGAPVRTTLPPELSACLTRWQWELFGVH